jgi:Zn-dependent protease
MLPTRQGSFRLFRLLGIDVYLHWSWFLIAFYGISIRKDRYTSLLWPALEYLALFGIVLMHEFGHALACRQTGGRANQIVLWPLGGVAYVAPPQRPGAVLWSIAAGPLVNFVLAPALTLLAVLGSGWGDTMPNAYAFVQAVCIINWVLLVFNLLPIYPLDGGQIFQALLWFWLGRARSLMVAVVVGFIGVACLIPLAVIVRSGWSILMCVFILLNCWRGLMQARLLARVARMPRRAGYACPSCRQPPVIGLYWRCDRCMKVFDTFETKAVCPNCGATFAFTRCLDCGNDYPFEQWIVSAPAAAPPTL